MLIHQTLERLHELRLTGMAHALEEQLRMHDVDTLAFEDRLGLLLEREVTVRDDRRLARRDILESCGTPLRMGRSWRA